MKKTIPLKKRIQEILAIGLAAGLLLGYSPNLKSDDTKPGVPATSGSEVKKPAASGGENTNAPAAKKPAPVRVMLSGAELYSMHCARCHPERYPNERTSAQWKTIVLHMRVRAGLPAEHANSILKYMQENSGY